jgi:ubiquinone/menaquinone biosynthesis C-methylase UbiE
MNSTDEPHSPSEPASSKANGHRWFAALYDRMGRSEEKGYLGEMRRSLLSGVTGDVLEIGAGTGANFEHYVADARVTAIEPDPFMAARAESKLAALGRTNITLQRGPAETLPFADASFDAIVSTLVLCTVSDVDRCLQEMRRVLRPNGKVLFIDMYAPVEASASSRTSYAQSGVGSGRAATPIAAPRSLSPVVVGRSSSKSDDAWLASFHSFEAKRFLGSELHTSTAATIGPWCRCRGLPV